MLEGGRVELDGSFSERGLAGTLAWDPAPGSSGGRNPAVDASCRDERQAGGVHLAFPAPHRPALVRTVPSSMVEARRRPIAQSSRSLRR